jgi:iron complex transport system substrate-binding protein
MSHRLFFAVCLLLAWPLLGPGASSAEIQIIDATGRTVTIHNSKRIVSVGGSVTEIVYALGLSDRIIAVDTTSLYPDEVKAKPNVGYMRQLSAEPILALDPSVVLADQDSGPPAVFDQLREAGLPVVLIPDDPTPHGVLDKIARVAVAVDEQEKGQALMARLKAELDALENAVAGLPSRPRVLFLLSVGGGGAPLAAGRNTSAAGIIELAGGVNAVDDFEDYKPLSPEAVVAAAPDFILVTDRSLGLLGGEEGLLSIPEVGLTPAGQNRRVVAMDGLLMLGFGPRTGSAIAQLANHLHPGITLRAANP